MANVLAKPIAPHLRRDARDQKWSLEYRLIFGMCFLVFLLAGIVERLLPWSWLAPSRDTRLPLPLIEQAWGAAGTCTAYAFKG